MPDSAMHYCALFGQVALLGGVLAIGLWLVRDTLKESVRSPGCWFGVWYCFGAIVCILALLPDAELEALVADAGLGLWMLLAGGATMILIGATIHIVLRLQGRLADRKEERAWIVTAVAVILMGVLFQFLRIHGLERWLAYFVGALLVLLLLGIGAYVLGAYARVRNLPVNRMARLLRQQKHTQAIEIGESIPHDQRMPPLQMNLAAAYWRSGQKDRARALLEELDGLPDLPAPIRSVLDDWLVKASEEKGVNGQARSTGDGE